LGIATSYRFDLDYAVLASDLSASDLLASDLSASDLSAWDLAATFVSATFVSATSASLNEGIGYLGFAMLPFKVPVSYSLSSRYFLFPTTVSNLFGWFRMFYQINSLTLYAECQCSVIDYAKFCLRVQISVGNFYC
jgi:hypothetical protein